MFNPNDYTPAQLRAIREIGDSRVVILLDRDTGLLNTLDYSPWETSLFTVMMLRIKGVLVRRYFFGNRGFYRVYRLNESALAWAREQNHD